MGKRAREARRHARRLEAVAARVPEDRPATATRKTDTAPTSLEVTVRLRQLIRRSDEALADVDAEVRRLADAGTGWVEISSALCVSRQAARQRYGK